MSALLDNAFDSLRVGMRFFLDRTDPSSGKYAILMTFHCLELMLKEALHRVHPVMIYKNLDVDISSDSLTVGLREILVRFKNLGINLSEEETRTLVSLQRRRNTI